MKKSLLTLAAALSLVGCQNEDLLNVDNNQVQEGNAITFSTYVGDNARTRASVVDIDTIRLKGFRVNAYYTGTTPFSADATYEGDAIFMKDTKVTYNAEKKAWTYSPVKYWPNNDGDMLSFFAYAPYTSSQITFLNESNKSKINFAVDADVKNQVDLIYHKADGDDVLGCEKTIDLEKQSVNSTVNFNFQHALSRITFDVKAVVDEATENGDNLLDQNTRINIKKVSLVKAVEGETEEGSFFTSANLNLQTGEWSDKTGTQPFVLEDDHFYRGVNVDGADVVQLTKFNPEQTLLNKDSYLMIIPQDFSEGGSETTEGYRIYIEYDVISEEVENNGSSENTTHDSNTIENKIYSNVMHTTFEAGKAYKFTLLLGMTSVKFTADVASWEDAEDYDNEEWLPENIPFTVDEDGNFLIGTADELATFCSLINHGGTYTDENGDERKYCDANYKQTANINLTDVLGSDGQWQGIGQGDGDTHNPHKFRGTYDGQGYTVSGLYQNDQWDSGLFYKVVGATIKNVTVEGTIENAWAGYVGGVVGYDEGSTTVENCHFSGRIHTKISYTGYYPQYIGGVVGKLSSNGTVTACSNGGTIEGHVESYTYCGVGGVVGSASGTVVACYNYGSVTKNTSGANVGGVAGYSSKSITGCYNSGSVKLAEDVTSGNIGTIVGSNSGTVSYSYDFSDATAKTIGSDDGTTTEVRNDVQASDAKAYMNYGLNQASVEYHYVDSNVDTYPLALAEGTDPGTEPEPQFYFEGEGTAENPFQIKTAADLVKLSELVAAEDEIYNAAHYIQMNNIDLSTVCGENLNGGTTWNAIGESAATFKGVYNGGDYEVQNLYCCQSDNLNAPDGLFGRNDGTVMNLKVVDCKIESNYGYVGAVVGRNEGKVINCHTVGGSVTSKSQILGGVIGLLNGQAILCSNSAEISLTMESGALAEVGGVVGDLNGGSVVACYNIGNITADHSGVGGVVGLSSSADNCEIISCYNVGTVYNSSSSWLDETGRVYGNFYGTEKDTYLSMSACYYDCECNGNGTDETVIEVDGESVTWEGAMNAMNEAISNLVSTIPELSGWSYESSGNENEPLVLKKN